MLVAHHDRILADRQPGVQIDVPVLAQDRLEHGVAPAGQLRLVRPQPHDHDRDRARLVLLRLLLPVEAAVVLRQREVQVSHGLQVDDDLRVRPEVVQGLYIAVGRHAWGILVPCPFEDHIVELPLQIFIYCDIGEDLL